MKGIEARLANCDPELGRVGVPCIHCGFYHLRPGYCQALDPRNPNYKGVTLSEDSVTVTPDVTVTDVTLKTCEVCGNGFEPKRATARFCSAACKMRAHRDGK